MKITISYLCGLGVAVNTIMFAHNLFSDLHQHAVFNLLCAGGCWIGYFKYRKGSKNGDQH